jgi:hypothetical protein
MKLFKDNNNIKVVGFGNYNIDMVWSKLKYKLFNKNLAMPRVRTVLNAAIFLSVEMGYKEVCVLGLNNDWFKNIFVDKDNVVRIFDTHFYESAENDKMPVIEGTVHEELISSAIALESHHRINEYAENKGVAIYNASSSSMVDAYKRKYDI